MRHPFFLDAFFTEKEGTAYLLSEPFVRLRDSWALINLVRYFAVHGIKLNVKAVLANATLLADYYELKSLETQKEAYLDVDDLLSRVNSMRRDKIEKRSDHLPPLHPSGPIVLLGRPSFYPKPFLDEIEKEFDVIKTVQPRFAALSDSPLEDFDKFRTIRDWYTGIRYRPQPFSHGPSPTERASPHIDWAVIRIVKSRFFKNRELIYAFGSGSVGTLGAVYCLIDPSWSERLMEQGNLQPVLEKFGYGEVLLRIYKDFSFDLPWTGEFRPTDIFLEAPAVPPVHKERAELINLFLNEPFDEEQFSKRNLPYTLKDSSSSVSGRVRTFEVAGLYPDDSMSDLSVMQMAGGKCIHAFIDELIRMVNSEPKAIFLVGENGVGKEVASKIIYQQRIIGLMVRLAEGKYDNRSIVAGPHFVALNLSAIPESLIERELFGIGEKMASDVLGNLGALLNAGEGVVLLDEIASMPKGLQAKLLRALEFPYEVSPIGVPQRRFQTSAMYVICCNEEPEELVSSGRLRADLYGRLKQFTVRIPPLRERLSDIPALLTYLAENPIRMNGNTLKALLMRDYPYNVRELYRFIRSSRLRREAGTDFIRIDLEDTFDKPYVNQVSDISKAAMYDSEPSLDLEFTAQQGLYGQKLFNVLEEAAIVLSSLEIHKDALKARTSSEEYSDIWPSLSKSAPTLNALIGRWVKIVSANAGTRRNRTEREDSADIALRTLGKMFRLRFKGAGYGMYGKIRKEFQKFLDADTTISSHDAAISLDTSDEVYCKLRNKRRFS